MEQHVAPQERMQDASHKCPSCCLPRSHQKDSASFTNSPFLGAMLKVNVTTLNWTYEAGSPNETSPTMGRLRQLYSDPRQKRT